MAYNLFLVSALMGWKAEPAIILIEKYAGYVFIAWKLLTKLVVV
jgi:hypothetical protein